MRTMRIGEFGLVTVPYQTEDHIVVALRRISQGIDTYSRQLLQEHGLTSPQIALLRELRQTVGTTPTALAEALHLSQPTIAGIIQRLERRGLISRRRDDLDRRSVILTLTDEGNRAVDSAPSLLRDRFCAELAKLDDWERTQMLATLQRIAAMMNAPDVEGVPFFVMDDIADEVAPIVDEAGRGVRTSRGEKLPPQRIAAGLPTHDDDDDSPGMRDVLCSMQLLYD